MSTKYSTLKLNLLNAKRVQNPSNNKEKKPSSKKSSKKLKKILSLYKIIGVNNKTPTIGLLCGPQPIDSLLNIKQAKCDHNTINWLYQSGAEIIPILPWINKKQLSIILSKIHGVVFPSGRRFLGDKNPFKNQYEKFARDLFNKLKVIILF
jgi:hypothetical protein